VYDNSGGEETLPQVARPPELITSAEEWEDLVRRNCSAIDLDYLAREELESVPPGTVALFAAEAKHVVRFGLAHKLSALDIHRLGRIVDAALSRGMHQNTVGPFYKVLGLSQLDQYHPTAREVAQVIFTQATHELLNGGMWDPPRVDPRPSESLEANVERFVQFARDHAFSAEEMRVLGNLINAATPTQPESDFSLRVARIYQSFGIALDAGEPMSKQIFLKVHP
jgi:hypothetical protein